LVAGNFSLAVLAIFSHLFSASNLVVVQASFQTADSLPATQGGSFVSSPQGAPKRPDAHSRSVLLIALDIPFL
jgi:hypothetical protein